MEDSFKFWILYIVLVTAVLVIGWNQPLRYRFMSKDEIAAIHAPTPAPQRGEWMWNKEDRSTMLERGAYGRRTGTGYVYYPR